jgi:FKBP-type peptidyl-prolyl cis-trans isomerase
MRKLAVLFLGLALTLGLVACEDTSKDTGATPTPSDSTPSATVVGQPTNIPKPDAEGEPTVTTSGLTIIDIEEGDGQEATVDDTVTVHYTGWLEDGTTFDSSVPGGQPYTTTLDRVIPGWTEGVPGMKVGGKRRLVIPADLAYGDQGSGTVIPPGATLTFDIELISIP